MTKSVRESRNFTRAGYVFIDGARVSSLSYTVELGRLFTLEIRFPNNVVVSREIMVVAQDRTTLLTPRVLEPDPTELKYKG
jgi:ribosomal protein S4